MTISKIITANHGTQVYFMLKEHILQRKFGPNEKIVIPELADQLGVSPTPIRDALNRLEAEGLIRTIPKVGTFVAPVTPGQVADQMETRLMMDWWVIDKWPELQEEKKRETVAGLQAIVAKAHALLTPETIELYEQSNLDLHFHLTLVKACGNARIAEVYETMMNHRFFYLAGEMITLEMYSTTVAQHADITNALSEGLLPQAKAAIRAHLDFSRNNLLAFIEQSGGDL